MDNVNIILMGKTGVGKSTIVNALLRENKAPVGVGQPITKENMVYSETVQMSSVFSNELKSMHMGEKRVNLCDTVGLEIDSEKTKTTLDDIKLKIKKAQESERNNDITLVWFCINNSSSRFETYEVQLIKMLSWEYEIPFVIVLTQCASDVTSEMQMKIERQLPEVPVARILAKEQIMRGGMTTPAFGLQKLFCRTIDEYHKSKVKILEEKLDSLLQTKNKRQKRLDQLKSDANTCIKKHSKKASKVGIIPGGCIPLVHNHCIKMISELNELAGIRASKELASQTFINAIVGVVATPFMAIPLLSMAAAPAYVEAVGEAYVDALLSVIRSASDDELQNESLLERRLKEEIRKHNQ